jgi:translation initiation factor 2 subunit 1
MADPDSLTNCRFYEEKYPEIESFVMVNVKSVRSMLHVALEW